MRQILASILLISVLFTVSLAISKVQPGPTLIDESIRWSKCSTSNLSIYDFQVDTLDDDSTNLQKYEGHVVLIVNVATFCAYTQQYLDFNGLIEKNIGNGKNFSIAAFPCNQFYLQEPAENHEIMDGITKVRPGNGWLPHKNLHVYGKLEVNGANHHTLYEFLKEQCPQTIGIIGKTNELIYNPIRPNDITWNFEKFLIDKKGHPRYRFHPTAWKGGQTVQKYIDELQSEE